MVFLFVLLLTGFGMAFRGFGQIQKSKMADHDGRHSEMITQLYRHVTSSLHDADVKGDISRWSVNPPSLVAIAFIFSESSYNTTPSRTLSLYSPIQNPCHISIIFCTCHHSCLFLSFFNFLKKRLPPSQK